MRMIVIGSALLLSACLPQGDRDARREARIDQLESRLLRIEAKVADLNQKQIEAVAQAKRVPSPTFQMAVGTQSFTFSSRQKCEAAADVYRRQRAAAAADSAAQLEASGARIVYSSPGRHDDLVCMEM